jgi:hypothetical protein
MATGRALKIMIGIVAAVLVAAAVQQASTVFAPLALALFIIAIVWHYGDSALNSLNSQFHEHTLVTGLQFGRLRSSLAWFAERELLRFARKHNRASEPRHNNPAGKSAKPVQPFAQKYSA